MEITEERLDQIFENLVDADDPCGMSDVLSALSDDELGAVEESALVQFGSELAQGTLECSAWICGLLLINANQPSICFNGLVLDAVETEAKRRKVVMLEPPSCGLRNSKGQGK
jgi:hypothetical protein